MFPARQRHGVLGGVGTPKAVLTSATTERLRAFLCQTPFHTPHGAFAVCRTLATHGPLEGRHSAFPRAARRGSCVPAVSTSGAPVGACEGETPSLPKGPRYAPDPLTISMLRNLFRTRDGVSLWSAASTRNRLDGIIAAMDTDVLTLRAYTAAIEDGWTQAELMRAILHDLPRRFHALSHAAQTNVLADVPPLTGSRWDALLAATVEHICGLHGHAAPVWVDEPARFLAETWVVTDVPSIRMNAIAFAPAAFIRHGALPDPRDFDDRCGEHRAWVP